MERRTRGAFLRVLVDPIGRLVNRSAAGLAGQTAIYGLTSILGRLLNYLLVPLHTRVFSNAQYGVTSLFYAYASFMNIVFTYGMETAFFRYFSRSEGEEQQKVYATAVTSLFLSTAILSALIAAAARPLAGWIGVPAHPEYVVWFSLIIGADTLCAIPFARLRQEKRAFRFAFYRIFNISVNIGLNLFFLLLCPLLDRHLAPGVGRHLLHAVYDRHVGIGYIFIANLAASLLTLLFFLPDLLRQRLRISFRLWRRMAGYAMPLLVVGLAGMVNETMDRIMLQRWLPGSVTARAAQIGIYSACYKLSIIMTLFIQAFRMAAEPFFFEKAGRDDAPRLYSRVMSSFVAAGSLIFLAVMLNIDLFKYFVGPNSRSGLHIVPVLLLANFGLGIYYNLSVWYRLTDQTAYGAYVSIFGAAVTLALNAWWIPRIGYTGSAWATFACYASMALLSYVVGQRFYPIPYDLRRLLGYPVASVLLWTASCGLHPGPIVKAVINPVLLGAFAIVAWKLEFRPRRPG
jgi:O-antigen/teichoic acid export membrane protein